MAEKLDGGCDTVDGVLQLRRHFFPRGGKRGAKIDKNVQKIVSVLRVARHVRAVGQNLLGDLRLDALEGLLQPPFPVIEAKAGIGKAFERLHQRNTTQIPRQCAGKMPCLFCKARKIFLAELVARRSAEKVVKGYPCRNACGLGYISIQLAAISRAMRLARSPPAERRSRSHSKLCSSETHSGQACAGSHERSSFSIVWPAKRKIAATISRPFCASPLHGSGGTTRRWSGVFWGRDNPAKGFPINSFCSGRIPLYIRPASVKNIVYTPMRPNPFGTHSPINRFSA